MAVKVLCIDDSPTIRQLVKRTLEPLGYVVAEAGDGQAGLEKAKSEPFDFFLVDVNMPVLGGFECVAGIKAQPTYARTPIVFLTTETSSEHRERGKQLGASGWMVKPFEPDALVKIVGMLAG